jgi:inorganic triphosphatase YgiF
LTQRNAPGKDACDSSLESAQVHAPRAGEKELEIELKMSGTADDLQELWEATDAPRTRTISRRLISTYFDTSDLRLRRCGFTLRVRQDGNDFVQTVKAVGSVQQSAMRRGEWSTPIKSPTPDLTRLDAPEVLEKIGLVITGELQPIFTTDVIRQSKRYRVNNDKCEESYIEMAWDMGEIRCDGGREAICEIELEWLEGSTVALQKEAVRFLEKTPLQFQPLSKSDRGFALAVGDRPTSRKVLPPKLTPKALVEEGLERVLTNCVDHWLANHAAVLDGVDVEGVHQMRVALRRMRSALTLMKSALPAADRQWLQREARSLTGDLGGARDWDVFVDQLLQPAMEARADDTNLKILRDAVNEQRRLAYERARATLRSPRYLRFVLELGVWLEGRGWRQKETQASLDRSLIDLADEVLSERHRQAMKLGRKFDKLSDEELHRLRISLKKLRYANEFFAGLYGKGRTEAYLDSLRQLQDDLGRLNDVAVAEARLGDLCGRFGSDNAGALQIACGTVIGWHARALDQIRPRIAKDWRAFTRARPFWKQVGVKA